MIQILGYLLCIYLVFKGLEILQLAITGKRDDLYGQVGMVVGGVAFGASIVIALIFAFWFSEQGDAMQNLSPRR